ncbi:hypothetical protein CAN34_10100 [Psychrobacter sp. DAB_AL32B]|nr:hypothetical protein CAN34_10100 [Psychrobacter sp. DAB_AL32B]
MASLTAFLSCVMYQAVNAFAKADRITQLYPYINDFDKKSLSLGVYKPLFLWLKFYNPSFCKPA